jgi:hypothetical protein
VFLYVLAHRSGCSIPRARSKLRHLPIPLMSHHATSLWAGKRVAPFAAAHEKRTGTDLVLDGSHGCAVFCCFRSLRDAVVEFGFELTG